LSAINVLVEKMRIVCEINVISTHIPRDSHFRKNHAALNS